MGKVTKGHFVVPRINLTPKGYGEHGEGLADSEEEHGPIELCHSRWIYPGIVCSLNFNYWLSRPIVIIMSRPILKKTTYGV